ncbi:UDP-N-acetylglucosamine 4,6-dehydratase family protein [Parvularcula sp. LCG005]|uniref:UDP-N-acetylglucosamine 4,6-dehydratase family protein n=1 Tax=Parvularcula sp. LCG005 TaxID=3078805 RepID=UPI002942CB8C|nr:polysaccharide biosynthesis protein [Parvularcula sp. LCG005]WOI53580.1 polysaccharide biosynthesis protein [Parvularcula sp. LCG005]
MSGNNRQFPFFRRRRTDRVTARLAPSDLTALELDSTQLLAREPRNTDLKQAEKLITGKRVMITGAGGTIGSELVRQVAQFDPELLILIDNSEFNLYEIDMELKRTRPGLNVVSMLVDVCRLEHLNPVFENAAPHFVLHAAAYKHVPIVERNPCAAALTNVLGAKNVFDAAVRTGCEAVVFISSDKAVNPTSFMGATKRIAELYAQSLDIAQTGTRFVTVRFGNVLGSTGSVAPLFQRQIAQGGPITVTHPDVQRYFMTTREAVQLVIQAASLSDENGRVMTHDGRIFVLDMGEPVRIVTLAERMIEAAGLTPNEDIKIVYTGLRPGEKLFEEIFHDLEKLVRTGVDGILLASPSMIDLPLLKPRLEDVVQYALSCQRNELEEAVHHLVPEFRPDPQSAQPDAIASLGVRRKSGKPIQNDR